jgi:hypothetical protein
LDGRNWKCPLGDDGLKSITLEMAHGEPVLSQSLPTRPFHSVAKINWWLIRTGVNHLL